MLAPYQVRDPLKHVCLIRRPDGIYDLYRPGSSLFGSLAPVPNEAARYFGGQLPRMFPHAWTPTVADVVGIFEDQQNP